MQNFTQYTEDLQAYYVRISRQEALNYWDLISNRIIKDFGIPEKFIKAKEEYTQILGW